MTTTPPTNAWKCHPPIQHLNLTDDTFPPLELTKKPKSADTVATEATTANDTPSLLTINLDEIDEKCEALCMKMQKEIVNIQQEMAMLHKDMMREDFMTQVGKMELSIEKNMKPMMKDFNERVSILTLNIQAVANSVSAHSEVNNAKFYHIMEAIESLGKCSLPTLDGMSICNVEKQIRGKSDTTTCDPMNIDFNTYGADGSLHNNPTASQAITPMMGKHTPAGASK